VLAESEALAVDAAALVSVEYDETVPVVDPVAAMADSASLVLVTAEHGSANLQRISIATGKVEALTTGTQDVVSYTATRDRSKLAVIVSSATNVGDIFLVDATRASPSSAQLARLTRVNDALFKDVAQSEPEEIWYTSFDGKKVQGWILKPPDFDPSRKYPMILEIHGGPHSAYGNKFTHEFLHTTFPLGQQRPKRAWAFLAMGFAQFRLQQLMFVEHTLLSGLQPSARTSRGQTNTAITARKTRERNTDRTRHIRPPWAGVFWRRT